MVLNQLLRTLLLKNENFLNLLRVLIFRLGVKSWEEMVLGKLSKQEEGQLP